MQESKKYNSILFSLSVLVVLTCLLLYFKYTPLVSNWEHNQLIESYGDGLKTYTNAAYHIKYDSTYTWFGGMNYPYGEHLVAATELPGIAILGKAMQSIFPSIADYIVQIIHAELLLAFLLCAVFLYLLFKDLKLPNTWAVPAALFITLAAPEHQRIYSHFGLAQAFVIPMLLYFLRKWFQSGLKRWSIFLGLGVLLVSLLHFYFFAVSVFLISGMLFFRFVFQPSEQEVKKSILHGLLMVGLPFLFFWFWMIGTDPVTDRSANPYGFFHYKAAWDTVFFNVELPHFAWINENLFPIRKGPSFEGRVYIGFPALVFSLFLSVGLIIFPFRKNKLVATVTDSAFRLSLLCTGVSLLLFSFAFPFNLMGEGNFPESLAAIRQFRSLGRFAWVFYYAVNILTVISLWAWRHRAKQANPVSNRADLVLPSACIFICLSFLTFEIVYLHKQKSLQYLSQVFYWKPGNGFHEIDSIDYSKYQASTPIPYYSIGSNNFTGPLDGFSSQSSYSLAIQTGVPTTGSMLTRSSKSQTFKQWQLITEPYRLPSILKDFPNEKPLLLLWFKEMKKQDKQVFGHLLTDSKLLFERKSLQIYETTIASFHSRLGRVHKSIKEELNAPLYPFGNILSSDSLVNFVYQDFDNTSDTSAYLGAGAYTGIAEEENLLFAGKLPHAKQDFLYTWRLWVDVSKDRHALNVFYLQEIAPDGSILQTKKTKAWKKNRVLDPAEWLMIEEDFRVKNPNSTFKIFCQRKDLGEQIIRVDELLIAPASTNLYRSEEDFMWKNNRNYPRNFLRNTH